MPNVDDLQDELTLTLRKPLMAGKAGEVTTLVLREPTADELDKFSIGAARNGSVNAMITLIATVSNVERPFIGKLGARDYLAAADYLNAFMNASPETGETPSPT